MSTRTPASRTRFQRASIVVSLLLSLLAAPEAVPASEPDVGLDEAGVSRLTWSEQSIAGDRPFAVKRVVLEGRGDESGPQWGYEYESVSADPTGAEVDRGANRVVHRYPWGTASLALEPGDDQLAVVLALENTSDRAIANFHVRMLDLTFPEHQEGFANGKMQLTTDRPTKYELSLDRGRRVFATYETFDPPLQFGVGPAHGNAGKSHALLALGGAPAFERSSPVFPILGRPRIAPGERLEMRFVLRFVPRDRPPSTALRPFYEAFREAQRPHLDWPDRRSIGRVDIPSSPRYMSPENPRGWFRSPGLDLESEKGERVFRNKLMKLADRAVERLEKVDAQGAVVWNLEGGHLYPEVPFGDPTSLPEIAPEMNEHADAFFEKFRDAGLEVGVTIRPSLLHQSKRRQRWTQNSGRFLPEKESFGESLRGERPKSVPAETIYPLAERLSAKIAYAKERWGCSIFYIHDNGMRWRHRRGAMTQWLYFDAGVLRRLRRWHPDVLLIPRYAERYMRSTRAVGVRRGVKRRAYNQSLRGVDEARIDGLPTPPWVVGNTMIYRYVQGVRFHRHVVGPRHTLFQGYWANSAPYVELKLKREIREHILTREQHQEYTFEEAKRMAEDAVPFETTPGRIREWMPDGFSVIDVTGANLDMRRSELVRSAAWGDTLMWNATGASLQKVESIAAAAGDKKRRLQAAANRLGIVDRGGDESVLPVSLIWRRGEPVASGPLVAGDRVPENLRARVARGPEKNRALLMLAWQGGRGRSVELRPGLPGVGLGSDGAGVWDLTTGARRGAGRGYAASPDPVAGMRALLLDRGAAPEREPPAGVLLGASFDDGLAPDVGGGWPGTRTEKSAERAAGRSGRALAVGGESAVGYGIVPDWVAGSVSFDLKARDPRGGLRVLSLGHHLDLKLTLARRDGRLGLALHSRENPLATGSDGASGPKDRTAFAPLPGGTGRWHRCVLTWELGQYRLYVDGERRAQALGPVGVRQRDGSVLQPGLRLGGAGSGTALIDSLVAYDWAMGAEPAADASRGRGMRPRSMTDRTDMVVWLWGSFPKKVHVGINARPARNWGEAKKFEVRIFKKMEAGRRRLAKKKLSSYGGVAIGKLDYKKAKSVDTKGKVPDQTDDMLSGNDGPSMGMGDGGASLQEFEEEVSGVPYIVEIKSLPDQEGPATRTFQITASEEGPEKHRW